jgi:hypothetical protein
MTISVTPAPRARSPSTISGVDVVPVTGSVGLSGGGRTATDVTTPPGGVDGGPITGTVELVVVGVGGRFPTAVVDVDVDVGSVVEVVEVVEVEDVDDVEVVVPGCVVVVVVVPGSVVVVVVVPGSVVVVVVVPGSVVVVVVVPGSVVDVVVVPGSVVDVVVVPGSVVDVVVVPGSVVDVVVVPGSVVDVVVVPGSVVDVVVVVGGGVVGPQNWMLEMSGVLPSPTSGSTPFENDPDVCAGLNVISTESLPPLMMIAEIGTLDWKLPPVASPETVTMPWLPDGFSKTYVPPWKLNLATSVVPAGQPCACDELVVCTSPTTSSAAPSSANAKPACQERRPRLPWSITGDAIELFPLPSPCAP